MRQILFIIVISAILLPLAASQQGLNSFDKVAALVSHQATEYTQILERLVSSE